MQIKKIPNKKTGDSVVYITHTMRDKANGGKNVCKTIKKLGKLSELEKEYGTELDFYLQKEKVACENAYKKQKQALTISLTPGEIINLRKKDAPDKVDNVRNIGCYIALKEYKKLGIDIFMNNKARYCKEKYSFNAIFRLLVIDRIITPGSKLDTYSDKDLYFFNTDFALESVYRALTKIPTFKDDFISYLNRKIDNLYPRDNSLLFYDVTNYYFEIDEEEDDKKEGCSKEHRKTPIIQMGLFMDANGLPVSFSTFSGNTPDVSTFVPAMSEVKEKFGMKHTIYVADKGMMSADNIANILKDRNGYIISDSVRKVSADFFETFVVPPEGYEDTEDLETGEVIYKCKELTLPQKKRMTTFEGGKRTFKLDERIVIFWSKKYADRAKYLRAKVVEKAGNSLVNPGNKVNNKHGANKFIKASQFSKETGEEDNVEKAVILEIDQELIDQDARFDGYYIIRSNVYGLEEGEKPLKYPSVYQDKTTSIKLNRPVSMYDIIDMYRGLWKIEETFKISKSGIKTRPVYLKRADRIQAHFLTCFTALVLLRMIELDTNMNYSTILRCLRDANYTKCAEDLYCIQKYDKEMEELSLKMGVPLNYKFLTKGLIKEIAGK